MSHHWRLCSTFILTLLLLPASTNNFSALNITQPPGNTPPSDGASRIDRILFQCVGTVGIIANLLIFLALSKNAALMGRFPRVFVCSQCGIDLAACVFIVLHQYWGFAVSSKLPGDVLNPDIYCAVFWSTYVLWGLMTSSTSNLMVQTIQRYVSVCHSAWHHQYMSMRVVMGLIVCGWMSGFLYQAYLYRFTYMEEDGTCIYIPTSAAMEIFNGSFIFLWILILPTMWITYCNGRIIYQLRKQRKIAAHPQPGGDASGGGNDEKKRREQNLLITFCAIGVIYIICHAPNQITWFVFMMGGPFYAEEVWYAFTVGLSFVNCAVNPIIYLVRMRSMREEVASILTCGLYSRQSGVGSLSQVGTLATQQHQATGD